ncbi:hypothetical protein Cgig2_011194 [Carnegiea gigantea]|uniref:Late embryogenesis abundant protein LEA-2 subgroup domain-containing protein n=1 Tax=Carnegiea gigantea TaxID=171969 RepID=A0A9Q1KDR1_9CARY|nr:hypothetical protein Cgig2_011194 [Carnegiea gigantea]
MNHQHLSIEPVENGPRPFYGRRQSARYYAHRVKESLATRVSKFICTVILFVLFVVGLIAFILWLSLRPHRPRFHLEEFSFPALAQPNAAPETAFIHFNVTIRNPNQKVEIHYDSIESTVYYREQAIGTASLASEAFDQESKNTTVFYKEISGPSLTVSGQRWINMQSDRTAGSVSFRLEITSVIKFEVFSRWNTKKHKMHANCPAVVGPDGLLLAPFRDERCSIYFT